LFHDGIHTFCLSISLGVEGSTQAWINLQAVAEVLPEAGCELWASVRYDCFRQAVEAEYVAQEQGGQLFGIDCREAWD
jgi:hypothetical protein